MNRSIFFIVIIFTAAVLSAAFLWWWPAGSQMTEEDFNNLWVEVISGGMFVASVSSEDMTIRRLESGDTIDTGEIIATDETGQGVVQLPDGSVLRIDPNTRMQIHTFDYDVQSGVLEFDTELYSGWLWSKMAGVTDPESLWRMRSPYAISTTSSATFGIFARATTSTVFNSAGVVSVSLQPTQTDEQVLDSVIQLTPDRGVTITEENILAAEDDPSVFEPTTLSQLDTVNLGVWVSQERNRDEIINRMIEELRGIGTENTTQLRQELSQRRYEQFTRTQERSIDSQDRLIPFSEDLPQGVVEIFEDIEEIRELGRIEDPADDSDPQSFTPTSAEVLMETLLSDAGVSESARTWLFEEHGEQIRDSLTLGLAQEEIRTLTRQYLEVVQNKAIAPPVPAEPASVRSVSVIATPELSSPVAEGSTINLRAMATLTDDTSRDVTEEVQWTVLGPIGVMRSPGVFFAELSSGQEGIVEASGSVVATFVNEDTNTETTGSTPIFRVVGE